MYQKLAGLFMLWTLGNAPLQCAREPDPSLRREDTAGDALWDLAETFREKGDLKAEKETLSFLATRYPSNRHALAAKERLTQLEKQ